MSVYLVATLDTKGREAIFVKSELLARGVPTVLIDAGCLGKPWGTADVTRQQVFQAAGCELEQVAARGDRGQAVSAAARGVTRLIQQAYANGQLSGVMAIGGSAGTNIGTAAMRSLPLGVPKVMVSTMASGDVRPYVGSRDIFMLNSVVDILGLNRISRTVLGEAICAMAGMVSMARPEAEDGDRAIVTATMFGVTTPCVEQARRRLESRFEVLVFHATGTGGQAMEGLIRDGLVSGVLDLTTTELADELVGGVLSAGPDRLKAASRAGVPQVVSVGATDMVNFGAYETVPIQFQHRQLHRHNDHVTLMRTTADECRQIGQQIAERVGAAKGPAVVMLPLRGVSAIDAEGQPFHDPQARAALFDAIRAGLPADKILELDLHINDPHFADAAAAKLQDLMEQRSDPSPQREAGSD